MFVQAACHYLDYIITFMVAALCVNIRQEGLSITLYDQTT